LVTGNLLGKTRVPELSQSHLAQCHDGSALSLLRQHLPDKGRRALAHRGIQANAPGRSTLGIQLWVIRRTLSIYQQHCRWDIEKRHALLKSTLEVAPIWLKKNARIEALMFLEFIAQMVAALAILIEPFASFLSLVSYSW
jgi:hypothetical protein